MTDMRFLLVLCCSLVLFGCKKESPTPVNTAFVEGVVLNLMTNEPIAGATVELWEDDMGGDTRLSAWDRKLGSTISDSLGRYKIPFEGCSNTMKQKGILAAKQNYYRYEDPGLNLINCTGDKLTVYQLIPSTWVRLNIKNIHPLNAQDSIFLSLTGPLVLKGTQVDTTLYFEIEGNSSRYFYWEVTRNGQTAARQGGFVFCSTPFDTCNYEIHY